MTEHVRTSQDGAVAVIRLARPEKKNALTRAMYEGMAHAIDTAEADAATRVILLAGGADFTAGNDIADFAAPRGEGPGAAFDFLQAMVSVSKPVVAAVRGNAVGIGTTLLLHCDVVVASETARLLMPFTGWGWCPRPDRRSCCRRGWARRWRTGGCSARAPSAGAEAQRAGLATRAVPDEEVEAVALEMARTWPACRRAPCGTASG
jgi:enoyl-CoA hydratase/carnithine racemase